MNSGGANYRQRRAYALRFSFGPYLGPRQSVSGSQKVQLNSNEIFKMFNYMPFAIQVTFCDRNNCLVAIYFCILDVLAVPVVANRLRHR